MTTSKEQEAFGLVVGHYKSNSPENEIRYTFQRFMEISGVATSSEMSTERPPGIGNPGRMDLYIHNTCIEFKTEILRNGIPIDGYVAQLDRYLKNLLKANNGVRNGILTDGVHYFLRRVGEEKLPLLPYGRMETFNRAEEAPRLREYLHNIISAPAQNVSPTAENLERYFGATPTRSWPGNLLLKEAYEAHRDDPTVAVETTTVARSTAGGVGQGCCHGRRRKRLAVHQAHLHHQPDRRHHAAATAGRRGPLRFRKAGRPAQGTHPSRTVRPARCHRRRPVHLAHGGGGKHLPTEIARVVEWFDWTQNAKEVGPTLYQNVITQEERKRLGEYYTPRWLAKEITQAVVDAPLIQRVLDPSCGSGTFIETTIEHILNHSGGLSKTETLKKLQENIVGIDIHPVAVQLAKATWVMAVADTIHAARAEGTITGAVSAPIYLGDSMQLHYNTGTLSASQSIELETHETLPGHTAPIIFSIPKELARRQADIDRLISEMAIAINEGRNAEHVADAYEMSDACRQSVKAVATTMQEMHAADRNHVWAYYIRNMIRPTVIAEEKVDRIIGNPPWLTYGQSADIIRQELREMSEKRYQIWAAANWHPTRTSPRCSTRAAPSCTPR